MDEALVKTLRARRGDLPSEQARSLEAEAIVDTGAVQLALPPAVGQKLGLGRLDIQMARYADGRKEELDVTEAIEAEIMGRRTTEEALVLSDEDSMTARQGG